MREEKKKEKKRNNLVNTKVSELLQGGGAGVECPLQALEGPKLEQFVKGCMP